MKNLILVSIFFLLACGSSSEQVPSDFETISLSGVFGIASWQGITVDLTSETYTAYAESNSVNCETSGALTAEQIQRVQTSADALRYEAKENQPLEADGAKLRLTISDLHLDYVSPGTASYNLITGGGCEMISTLNSVYPATDPDSLACPEYDAAHYLSLADCPTGK